MTDSLEISETWHITSYAEFTRRHSRTRWRNLIMKFDTFPKWEQIWNRLFLPQREKLNVNVYKLHENNCKIKTKCRSTQPSCSAGRRDDLASFSSQKWTEFSFWLTTVQAARVEGHLCLFTMFWSEQGIFLEILTAWHAAHFCNKFVEMCLILCCLPDAVLLPSA